MPQLIFNGQPVPFSQQQAYYQSTIGPVATPPTGSKTRRGELDGHRAAVDEGREIHLRRLGGWSIGGHDAPPICPDGSYLKIVVFTPNCLAHALVQNGPDGRNDTSQSACTTNGRCPVGYDPILQARIEVKYPRASTDSGKVAFSSGPYWTMHTDWFNGWDHTTLDRFVNGCVNRGVDCGNTMP